MVVFDTRGLEDANGSDGLRSIIGDDMKLSVSGHERYYRIVSVR
jgi:hypothetical protein